jgi:hypothetical protein
MADLASVEDQLKRINSNYRFWGRWDAKELANVLLPGETIEHCVNGIYEGGFAQMTATDQRLILIDRKPMYLTLEDIRFDMVSELDYNHRLINSTLKICTPNQTLIFKSYNRPKLRNLFNFAQRRVMEIRHYYMEQQGPQTTPQPQSLNFSGRRRVPTQQFFQQQDLQQQTQPDQQSYPQPDALMSAQPQPPSPVQSSWQPPAQPQPQQFQSDAQQQQQTTDFIPQVVQAQQQSADGHQVNAQQLGVAGIKRMLPVLNAYTRSPILSRRSGYSMNPDNRIG